jgi:hypothetical protein
MSQVAALLQVRQRVSVGLVEAEHARKLVPWTARLKAAREGLAEAVARGDRRGAVRGIEDIWFWIGRLTAELLAVEDPKYNDARMAGAQEIIAAQREVGEARRLLAGEPSSQGLVYVGTLVGAARRNVCLDYIDYMTSAHPEELGDPRDLETTYAGADADTQLACLDLLRRRQKADRLR